MLCVNTWIATQKHPLSPSLCTIRGGHTRRFFISCYISVIVYFSDFSEAGFFPLSRGSTKEFLTWMRSAGAHCWHKTIIIAASRNVVALKPRIKIYFLFHSFAENNYKQSTFHYLKNIIIMPSFISPSILKSIQGEILKRKFLVYIHFKSIYSSLFLWSSHKKSGNVEK